MNANSAEASVTSRILVVYYSRTGHTDQLARQIATRMHADLERIEDRHGRNGPVGYLRSAMEAVLGLQAPVMRGSHRPGNYDLVILGTPVWFWGVASPVRTWVARHRASLSMVAVFCTYGGSGSTRALDDLEGLCGRTAMARLALTERAVAQCQKYPAFRHFIQALRRKHPLPALQSLRNTG